MMEEPLRILFVCSRNQWRSRTAEQLFRQTEGWQVRSAGTASSARIRVSAALIEWAEVIFVMEDHHKKRLREQYRDLLRDCTLHVLHIPDIYRYQDPELVELLESSVAAFLEE